MAARGRAQSTRTSSPEPWSCRWGKRDPERGRVFPRDTQLTAVGVASHAPCYSEQENDVDKKLADLLRQGTEPGP